MLKNKRKLQEIEKKLVICFSTSSYNSPIWTNKQHLMNLLSKNGNYKVLYIDQGMSSRYLRKAIRERDWKFLLPLRNENENLLILSPFFLPLIKGGIGKKVAWFLMFTCLEFWVKAQNFKQTIYWIYQPQAWYYVRFLKKSTGITIYYDCVDQFGTQPFYKTSSSRLNELIKIESLLVNKADVVTTTSNLLCEDHKKVNPNTYCIHNVADFEHFSEPSWAIMQKDRDLFTTDLIKVVYAGVIDDYKTDLNLITQMAHELYGTHVFIFVGPVRISENSTKELLLNIENVVFIGERPFSVIPDFLHLADILWLPYVKSSHTDRVFPLKLFEYMSTMKPVVATLLHSFSQYSDSLCVFSSGNDCKRLLENISEFSTSEVRERAFLQAKVNTWESRLGNILDLLV